MSIISLPIIENTLFVCENKEHPQRVSNLLSYLQKQILNNRHSWRNLGDCIVFQSSEPEFKQYREHAHYTEIFKYEKVNSQKFKIQASSDLGFLAKSLSAMFNTAVYLISEDQNTATIHFCSIGEASFVKSIEEKINVTLETPIEVYLFHTDFETYKDWRYQNIIDPVPHNLKMLKIVAKSSKNPHQIVRYNSNKIYFFFHNNGYRKVNAVFADEQYGYLLNGDSLYRKSLSKHILDLYDYNPAQSTKAKKEKALDDLPF